jgi:hypothetical protein
MHYATSFQFQSLFSQRLMLHMHFRLPLLLILEVAVLIGCMISCLENATTLERLRIFDSIVPSVGGVYLAMSIWRTNMTVFSDLLIQRVIQR